MILYNSVCNKFLFFRDDPEGTFLHPFQRLQIRYLTMIACWNLQARRKLAIEKVCQKHGSELYYEDVPLIDTLWSNKYQIPNLSNIYFLQQYNILYCGIPKSGTSTWVEGRISMELFVINQLDQSSSSSFFYDPSPNQMEKTCINKH